MTSEFLKNLLNQLQKRSTLWFIVWILLFLLVPILLIGIHIFIINGINSGEISETTISTIYTNTTNPSVSSLFVTNYVHKLADQGSHLFQNIAVYLFFILLIFLSETFFLLPNESDRSEKEFFCASFLFFLILPFVISGISLIIFRIVGGTGFCGFSGIVAAFIGYFWFTLYNFYFLIRQHAIQKNFQKIWMMDIFLFGCFFIPIFSFILMNLLSYDNFGAHTAGYFFGFFTGCGMFLARKKKCDKIIIALIFTVVIWIASTFWIFL